MSSEAAYHFVDPAVIPSQEISDAAALAQKPLASVKMITYNQASAIAQAIEGVLQQKTRFPFELVIGEDCSTDATRGIVLDYQKRYPQTVRIITSERNVGARPNAARTHWACRGKYLAYCEGDDFWHDPLKLQKQVDYLEAHPDVGLVHSDVVWHDVRTGRTSPAHYRDLNLSHDDENAVKGLIEFKYHVITCSVVLRKDLLDEILGTCRYEFSETFPMRDIQMWIEMAYRSKVKYMDEPLATYNAFPESTSSSRDIHRVVNFSRSLLRVRLHYAEKYGGPESARMKRAILAQKGPTLLCMACRAGRADVAREILTDSRKYEVPLQPLDYLYFVGSQNKAASYLVRLLVWPARVGARLRHGAA